MSDERYERRRERLETRFAREAEKKNSLLNTASTFENLSGPEIEAQLRKRVEDRIKNRNAFYIHLIAFLGTNLLLWTIWLTADPFDFPWPLYAVIPWTMGLAIHGLVVYQDSGMARQRYEQRIRREVEMEKMRLGLAADAYQKPKRDQTMRLSDDGELIADDESEPNAKVKRG
jgi:hypothetical protein